MKRNLLVFAIILLCTCTKTLAQQDKGNVEFGLGAGIGGTTVSDDNGNNSSSRTAFNAGISGDYYFSDRWSLKAKLLYDQKGWNNGYFSDANSESTYGNYHLDYLTLPVMANWHFGRTRNWYLNFGPYIGFLLSAKFSENNFDLKPYFNKVDGGLAFGIGIKFPIADQTKFFIEFDGQGGIANIAKETDGSVSSIHNSRGSFNIGINF